MVRLPAALIVPAVFAVFPATGCLSNKPMRVESLNQVLKDALPSAATPAASPPAEAAPLNLNGKASGHQAATEFVAAWRSQLGQLPDPTKNGAMKPGLVGQVFIMNDKHLPAEVTGSLTIAATDATDRPAGQPPRQPNAWHFDVETLKRMRVVDDRFGKCIAVFLPWPEEWVDVNRLQIQARYDQAGAGTYTLYAPQSTVTLDFITNGAQVNMTQGRFTTNAMTVPDPKMMFQQAKATVGRSPMSGPSATQPNVPPPNNPVLQAGFQQPAWPNAANPPAAASFGPPVQQPASPAFPTTIIDNLVPQPAPNGSVQKEDVKFVVPRN